MLRVALGLVAAFITATTASASEDNTLTCRPDTGFGPGPISAYACRDPKTGSPFDDCFRAGVLVPVLGPNEAYLCDPT